MTVDERELNKFAQLASQWWDPKGQLKTLHHINPIRLEFISQHVSISDKRVLDLGCGGGILSEGMTKQGAQVVGIDREDNAIGVAREHAKNSGLNIDYQAMAIEDYDGGDFDVITCMEMLEHVPDPEHIIEQCAKRLKPQGWCFLSTLNRTVKAYSLAILGAEYLLNLLPRQTHDYQKFIKPSELARLLRQQGLELVALKGMAYNPLSQVASLCDDVSVNYLMAARRVD